MSCFNRNREMSKWDRKKKQGSRDEETEEVKRAHGVKKKIRQNYQKAI